MSELNIDATLCRVCLSDGNYDINNVNLSIDNNTILLKTALEVFSKLDIIKTENYPKNLCDSCTEDLSNAYKFYLKVLYSEQLLMNHFYRDKVPKIEGNSDDEYVQMVEGNTDDLVEEEYIIEECDDYNSSNTVNDKLSVSQSRDNEQDEEASKEDENEIIELHEIDEDDNIEYNKKTYSKSITNKTPNMCLTNNVVSILSKSEFPTRAILNRNSNKRKYSNSNDTPNSFSNETLSSLKKLKCLKPDNFIIVPTFVISEKKRFDTKSEDLLQKNLLSQDDDDDTQLDNLDHENNLPKNVKTLEVAAFKLDQSNNHNFSSILPSNKLQDDETFQCNYCQKAFGTSYHLLLHTRKSHVCQFCLEAFQKVADLHKHVKENHNKFECSFCGRMFSNNSNLRCHMRKAHEISLPAHVSLITVSKNDDQESIN